MKKIMFNDKYGLTQAVLEGRKTQTRRLIPENLFQECRSNGFLEADGFNSQWKEKSIELLLAHSTYKIGEEVAVAQKYDDVWDFVKSKGKDDDLMLCANLCAGAKNKLYVKAGLMPHRIRITNARVERLQDISDEDCLKEGIIHNHAYGDRDHEDYGFAGNWYTTARKAFAALIDLTCGRGTWVSNPYVFVYDFELVK